MTPVWDDQARGTPRDHGGGLDAAIQIWGGARGGWLDLSTGINPAPYPLPHFSSDAWTALPDIGAVHRLTAAARTFWDVPEAADILPCHGASAAIARLPELASAGRVQIQGPTYNEHAAAFRAAGWQVSDRPGNCQVVVHPNNPDGRLWRAAELTAPITIIDESFCDVTPGVSHIARAANPGTLVLKSFGKFWGLAGLRLGFVIGDPGLISRLAEILGPWPVSGPALETGAAALSDPAWAQNTRRRLAKDAARLDRIMLKAGAENPRGTSLFRLYDTSNARHWHAALARKHILTRIFPWSETAIRLGLPAPAADPDAWARLEDGLDSVSSHV